MTLISTAARGGGGGGGGGLTAISDQTLSGSAANITFSSIPATFKHLLILYSLRGDNAATFTELAVQTNGAGTYYNESVYAAAASPAAAERNANGTPSLAFVPANTAPANFFGTGQLFVADYANTVTNKVVVCTSFSIHATTAGNTFARCSSSGNSATTAITSLVLIPFAGNWVTGSRATLYGI